MKKHYLGIPALVILVFAFYYADWSAREKSFQETQQRAAAEAAAEEAKAKLEYQAEIQRKAKAAAEAKALKLAEKRAREETEEKHWIAINQELDTANKLREELTDKVYETTNLLYLEQERRIRREESFKRALDEKRSLAQYLPEAESNRIKIAQILQRAESLSAARIEFANASNLDSKRK